MYTNVNEKDYRGQDLNLHTLRRPTLNQMRLPIPPPRGCFGYYLDLYVPLVSGLVNIIGLYILLTINHPLLRGEKNQPENF